MNRGSEHPAIDYVAEIDHVREVTLHGTADPALWREILRPAALRPAAQDAAELEIMATELRWKGLRFREWSVSLAVCTADAPAQNGGYLVQAFNSSALLAWAERTIFKTPYQHGAIQATTSLGAGMALTVARQQAFHACMDTPGSAAETTVRDWRSPVFLPAPPGSARKPGQQFYVRLQGAQDCYPFNPERDQCTLRPVAAYPVFQWLIDSHFTPLEWRICQRARHSKSKTYPRP